jgi:hypothetical protein
MGEAPSIFTNHTPITFHYHLPQRLEVSFQTTAFLLQIPRNKDYMITF